MPGLGSNNRRSEPPWTPIPFSASSWWKRLGSSTWLDVVDPFFIFFSYPRTRVEFYPLPGASLAEREEDNTLIVSLSPYYDAPGRRWQANVGPRAWGPVRPRCFEGE